MAVSAKCMTFVNVLFLYIDNAHLPTLPIHTPFLVMIVAR